MQPARRKETKHEVQIVNSSFILVASLVMLPTLSWGAEDGAALYKSKCADCHGVSGEGKPAMKAPALRGTPLTADQITERTMKGIADFKGTSQ